MFTHGHMHWGKTVLHCYLYLTSEFTGKSIYALEKYSYTTTVRADFGCDRCIKNKMYGMD